MSTDSISGLFIQKMNLKKTFNTQKEINNIIIDIRKKANRNGYLFATIKKEIINDSISQISFKLNRQFENIKILYNENTIKRIEIEKVTKNKIKNNYFLIKTKNIEKLLNKLIENKNNTGEIFTNIQLKNIHAERNNLTAELQVVNKNKRVVNEIKIKGYKSFPKKFIKHYLKIKKNNTLNLKAIEEKSLALGGLSFAKEIKKPEILFKKDSSTIYLNIKKKKANEFEGFLGFTSKEESDKIEFNGNINLNLINNLNRGEELKIIYKSSENEQKETNIRLKIPYIINSPLSITSEISIFKKDTSFTNNTQYTKIEHDLINNLKIGAGYKTIKSNSLYDSINQQDFKTKAYSLNLTHTKPNVDEIYKYKTKTTISASINERKTDSEKTNQQELNINSQYSFKLNNRNSIYIKTLNYYLFSKNTLDNELMYIGGINSLRGVTENSIPSSQYSILNTEYRIKLNKKLYTHTVIDYAITKNKNTNNFNKIIGFGLGLKIKTNNNILSFIIANSKTEERKINVSESKIHVSLRTIF
ncbi:hypothetical protein OAX11_00410 [Flavobacteriaceae bacterium]|nr:hypothetical protein [Flavobacteriaceae bacterium]